MLCLKNIIKKYFFQYLCFLQFGNSEINYLLRIFFFPFDKNNHKKLDLNKTD